MKVLFVSHCLPPTEEPDSSVGGMQRVASELADALAARRDIEYDSIELRSSWRSLHIKVPSFLLRTALALRRKAADKEVDVVLFSSMVSAVLVVALHRCFRQHSVATAAIVHGLDVTANNRIYQSLVRRTLRLLDLALPVSEATAVACIDRGLQQSHAVVVPNGTDMARFSQPGRPVNQIRRDTDLLAAIPSEAFIICSVGRQIPRKGFSWFVENVLPLLPNDVHYVLAGDGPEARSISRAARAAAVTDRVHQLGRLADDQIRFLYSVSHVFVMPNVPVSGDMEGFGVVLLEAGASGLPAVASRLEGIVDVIEEGQNGRLVEPNNAGAFAQAIREYYDDRARLSDASTRAHAHTRHRFNWQRVSDTYVSVLKRLGERR